MKVMKAFKFRLKPSYEQQRLLGAFAGCTHFLWNKALNLNLSRLKQKKLILRYHELDFWSKLWKKSEEYGFLSQCPAHILQQKLRDLDRAFKDAFNKEQPNKRLPRHKKRGVNDSFRFPEPKQVKLEHQHVILPKLGRMRFYRSQDVVGDIKNYSISRQGEHWYISIVVELEISVVKSHSEAIGLDLGIKHFVTTSKGEHKAPLNSFKTLEKKLAIKQRRLSKKKKLSSNWKKCKRKVTKIYQKISYKRHDFQHKLSTQLCNNHAVIVVERLKVKNMTASAKGTVEEPGVNVGAKSGLNKSILDQGWYEFKRQLNYKLHWRNGMLIEINPQYTSQRCSNCQYVDAKNRQTQEKFVCLQCCYSINADVNAARNILAAGHAVMACGASA